MEIQKIVGEAIQSARQLKGLSQSELATKLKTSTAYVSFVEQGLKNITMRQLQRFADAMEVRGIDIKLKTR